MYWLTYQQVIEEEQFDSLTGQYNIKAAIIIRKVDATSMEQAIGKFMLDTSYIKFKRRIEPVTCFELDKLKTI